MAVRTHSSQQTMQSLQSFKTNKEHFLTAFLTAFLTTLFVAVAGLGLIAMITFCQAARYCCRFYRFPCHFLSGHAECPTINLRHDAEQLLFLAKLCHRPELRDGS